jgi:hypothetical protein
MHKKLVGRLAENVETLKAIFREMFDVPRNYGVGSASIRSRQHVAVIIVWHAIEGS